MIIDYINYFDVNVCVTGICTAYISHHSLRLV